MADTNNTGKLGLLAYSLLVCSTLFQFFVCFLPVEWIVTYITVDDTFLYLKTAQNFAETGFSSFDGVTPTNGYQPLFFVILTGLACIFDDPVVLLRAALLVCVGLNLLTGLLLSRLGATWGGRPVQALTVGLWAIFMLRPDSIAGMEAPLHGAVFAGVLLMASHLWSREVEGISVQDTMFFGLLLGLNGLCRLDSGIISAGLALLFLWRFPGFKNPRIFSALFLFPALLAGGYFFINYSTFGHPTPISGKAKIFWAHQAHGLGWDEKSLVAAKGIIHTIAAAMGKMGGAATLVSLPEMPKPILVVIILLISGLLFFGSFMLWSNEAKIRSLFFPLIILMIAHIIFLNFLLQQFGPSQWYHRPFYLMVCLICAGVAIARVNVISNWRSRLITMALSITYLCNIIPIIIPHPVSREPTYGHDVTRISVLLDLHESGELSSGAVVGSWNSGQLGYFAPDSVQVVNLDGLVQDHEYLETVLRSQGYTDYFRDRGITHLADHNRHDLTLLYLKNPDPNNSFRQLFTFDEAKIIFQDRGYYLIDIRSWLNGQSLRRSQQK